MEETCQCQAGTHGHEQGACPNAATEEDRLCKQCRDMTAADEAMQAIRSATDGANLPQAPAWRGPVARAYGRHFWSRAFSA